MDVRRGFISLGILLAILVGLAVVGGGAYYVGQQNAPSQTASEDNLDTLQVLSTTNNSPETTVNTPTQSNAVRVGWKRYENKEIGIAFEYPESWGEISVNREKGCMYENTQYYGEKVASEMKKKLDTTGDPCLHLTLRVGERNFLATQSALYAQYPVPRGGYWGDAASSIKTDEYVRNFCSTSRGGDCKVFTTSNGIRVASYVDSGVCEMGCQPGTHYVIKSPHAFYFGLTLLASDVGNVNGSDFERLINSLRFI